MVDTLLQGTGHEVIVSIVHVVRLMFVASSCLHHTLTIAVIDLFRTVAEVQEAGGTHITLSSIFLSFFCPIRHNYDLRFRQPTSRTYRRAPDGEIVSSFVGGCRGVGAVFVGVFRAPEQDRLRNWPRDVICRLAV